MAGLYRLFRPARGRERFLHYERGAAMGNASTHSICILAWAGPGVMPRGSNGSQICLSHQPPMGGELKRKSEFKAKDIFRASGLSLPGVSNLHSNGKLVIADGYHRMCAVYTFDEDAVIAWKIV